MSVKNVLLALISEESRGVYQLKAAFEERTGHTWPMNIGQVYQSVQRMERDGLVEVVGEESQGNRSAEVYGITPDGRAVLAEWWATPIIRSRNERDDLVMRIAVAAGSDIDLRDLIQAQREATIKELRAVTKLMAKANPENLTAYLLIQRRIFDLESENRWLDHIESVALQAHKKGHQS